MTLQVTYPHDRRSREPRPLKAREIWSIAEHVRQQFLLRRPNPCVDLERLVRAARNILVNGIEIVVHWDRLPDWTPTYNVLSRSKSSTFLKAGAVTIGL
jgi:hypothetical protein